MASLIGNFIQQYKNFVIEDKYADPRTKDFFLISRPATLIMILASYLYFCTKAGPKFMEGRKPYKLKKTLIVYNTFQVLFSCYIVYVGCVMWSTYDWHCAPIDYTDTLLAPFVCWSYFFAKITELLDTVFFVLRKKYNQITFLHLFHHTVMPLFSWIGVRYVSGGHGTSFGMLNSFVHIIMYSYYLVAGLGPEYQKYLWWKKHLTGLQLVQFGMIFLHNAYALFSDCTYPKILHVSIMFFTSCFIYMFGKFYIKSYMRKPKENKTKKIE